MINLVKFKRYLSSSRKDGPPVSISAKDLDGNFDAVTPQPDKFGVYSIDFKKDGYSITFEAKKRAVSWREIDICVNGAAKKMMVLGTDPY
jgi:hypothetical protein